MASANCPGCGAPKSPGPYCAYCGRKFYDKSTDRKERRARWLDEVDDMLKANGFVRLRKPELYRNDDSTLRYEMYVVPYPEHVRIERFNDEREYWYDAGETLREALSGSGLVGALSVSEEFDHTFPSNRDGIRLQMTPILTGSD